MRSLRVSVIGIALAVAAAAQITDPNGIILIDQQHALAGGIGPGDASGFPVTITSPGSYRLTSNLVVWTLNTTAIEIKADHVTLDLNGFSILGPNVCPDDLSKPCPKGTGAGVYAQTEDVTVRNGTVAGMGASGVVLNDGTVREVKSLNNGGIGINVYEGYITDSSATHNGAAGLSCVDALIMRNVSKRNPIGLYAGISCGYSNNVFLNDKDVVGGVNLGQNSCSSVVCP